MASVAESLSAQRYLVCSAIDEYQELIYNTTSRDAYREYHSDPKECVFCSMRDDYYSK
ncbi:hypothetical protein VspSTUT16_12960 [Vibrio sp. STUT-A16]|nr:hypothetical protein VspSTUT16_12960 [Vibrio sp. STUT-A16]